MHPVGVILLTEYHASSIRPTVRYSLREFMGE